VKYDAEKHVLTFQTAKLMPLGMLVSRIKLLPYSQWVYRPTSDATGVLFLTPENNPLPEPISFSVGVNGCRLLTPNLPALEDLTTKDRPPAVLLKLLSDSGIHLLPEDRDAEFTGMVLKEKALEVSMCQELSLLAATFMIANSKWNKEQEAPDCIVRICESLDYTRCEARDAIKMFTKENDEVGMGVLGKEKGCAFLPIKDSHEEMPKGMATQITPWPDVSWEKEETTPLRFSSNLEQLLKDSQRVQHQTLERIEYTTPEFSETLQHLMYTLRLLSFG
jgi:cancer susceptibility candidate protein 1